MRPETLAAIEVKPKEEIVERIQDLIKRHRRKYMNKLMRPCPENCKQAVFERNRVSGCSGCHSRNPESCNQSAYFVPVEDKQKLYEEFSDMLRNREVLMRDYRDIAVLLWVIGAFDEETPDERVVQGVETRKEA